MSTFPETYNDTLEFRNLYKKGTYLTPKNAQSHNINGLKLFVISPALYNASNEAMVFICKDSNILRLPLRSLSLRAAMGEEVEKGGEDLLLEGKEGVLLGLHLYKTSLFSVTKNCITKIDLLTFEKKKFDIPSLCLISFFEDQFVLLDVQDSLHHYFLEKIEKIKEKILSKPVSLSFNGKNIHFLLAQNDGSSSFLSFSLSKGKAEFKSTMSTLVGVYNVNSMMRLNDDSFIISSSKFVCYLITFTDGVWNSKVINNPCNSRFGRKNTSNKEGIFSFMPFGPWTIISDSTCGDLAIISNSCLLILESDPFLPQLPLTRDGKMRELQVLSMELDFTSNQRILHRNDDPDTSTPSLPPQPTLWILTNEYSFVTFKIINQDLKAESLCFDATSVANAVPINDSTIPIKECVKVTIKVDGDGVDTPSCKEAISDKYKTIFHSKDDLLKNTLIREFATLSIKMNDFLLKGRQDITSCNEETNSLIMESNNSKSSISEKIHKISSLYNSLLKGEERLIKSSNEMMEMISIIKSRNLPLLSDKVDYLLKQVVLLKKATTKERRNALLFEIKRENNLISYLLKEGSIKQAIAHKNRNTSLVVIEEKIKSNENSSSSASSFRDPMKIEENSKKNEDHFNLIKCVPKSKLISLDVPMCTLDFEEYEVKEFEKPQILLAKIPDSTPPLVIVDKPDSVVIVVKKEENSFDFSNFDVDSAVDDNTNDITNVTDTDTPSRITRVTDTPSHKANVTASVTADIVKSITNSTIEFVSEEDQENMEMDTFESTTQPLPHAPAIPAVPQFSSSNLFSSFNIPKLQSTSTPQIPTFGTNSSFASFSQFKEEKIAPPIFGSSGFAQNANANGSGNQKFFNSPAPIKSGGLFGSSVKENIGFASFSSPSIVGEPKNVFGSINNNGDGISTFTQLPKKEEKKGQLSFTEFRM